MFKWRQRCRSSSLILLYWWKGHQVDLIDVERNINEFHSTDRSRHKTFDHDIWWNDRLDPIYALQFACLTCNDEKSSRKIKKKVIVGWYFCGRAQFIVRCTNNGALERRRNIQISLLIVIKVDDVSSPPLITFHIHSMVYVRTVKLTKQTSSLECEMRQFHSLTQFAYFSNLSLISLVFSTDDLCLIDFPFESRHEVDDNNDVVDVCNTADARSTST